VAVLGVETGTPAGLDAAGDPDGALDTAGIAVGDADGIAVGDADALGDGAGVGARRGGARCVVGAGATGRGPGTGGDPAG
jgi:hypothetical protein